MTLSRTPSFVWDPAQYAAHSEAQRIWARELISKLALQPSDRALDVGCGDGKVTAELAAAVSRGEVIGIDSSSAMIEFARSAFPASQVPNLRFLEMDARHIDLGAGFDLVFSNAALHWVDDHPAFLRGAAAILKEGGRLVVSCGGKGNAHGVFQALRGEIRRAPWRPFFRNLSAPYHFHGVEEYERWLPRFGFRPSLIRLAPKPALHPGIDGFKGWFRTTWHPYTQRVPEPDREAFIDDVARRYVTLHPIENGMARVDMVRLEIDAIRQTT